MSQIQANLVLWLIFFLQNIMASQTPTDLLIGETQKIRMIDSCEAYRFPTNYKQLNLKLLNMTGIDKVLITDKYFSDCSESSLLKCGQGSNICQSYHLKNTPLNFSIDFSVKLCLPSIIVYMVKDEKSPLASNNSSSNSTNQTKSHFFIHSSYSNQSCGYTHNSTLAYCSESKIDDCKNCKWKGCSLIQCGAEVNKQFVKKVDLCLPKEFEDKQRLATCLNFADVTTYVSTSTCEDDSLEGYSFITVFIIGIIVIGVLVLSITVIYYNIYLVKNKQAPFSVPEFCPDFLFPKENNSMQDSETERNLKVLFSEENKKNFSLLDK